MKPKKPKNNSFDVQKWTKANKSLSVEYSTAGGVSLVGKSEEILSGPAGKALNGKVQLVFTSPPFPLNRKKKYGNLEGAEFKKWLRGYAVTLRELLTEDGSIVIEMGNGGADVRCHVGAIRGGVDSNRAAGSGWNGWRP